MFGQEVGEKKPKKPKKPEPQTIAEAFPSETELTLPDRDKSVLLKMIDIYLEQVVTTGNINFSTPEIRAAGATRFDLWYLLAHKHFPNILVFDENGQPVPAAKLNSVLVENGVKLDEESLLLLQLHPRLDLVDLKGHGEITDELLAVSLFIQNYNHRPIGEELLEKRIKLRGRWEKYFHIPKEGYGRQLMILSLWNRWQWEEAQVDSEAEKQLIISEGMGYQNHDNLDEEWKRQWNQTFKLIWPGSWQNESAVEKTLQEFCRRRIVLSDDLKKAMILHPDRKLSILLAKYQPLSIQELTFLFKRLKTISPSAIEPILIYQHVLGKSFTDILRALETSKISAINVGGFLQKSRDAQSNKKRKVSMTKHLQKTEREFRGVPARWNFPAMLLYWWRNRHDHDGEYDIEALLERDQKDGEEISLADLLEEYEQMRNAE